MKSSQHSIYVAGPMRGHKEFNFPAFCKAAEELRELGWNVFNPAERDLATGFDPRGLEGTDEELSKLAFNLREALGADVEWICHQADAIYMLKGWEKSTGAVAERALAEALGHQIYEEEPTIGATKVRDCVVINSERNWP